MRCMYFYVLIFVIQVIIIIPSYTDIEQYTSKHTYYFCKSFQLSLEYVTVI